MIYGESKRVLSDYLLNNTKASAIKNVKL